ncbi:hypothetical protein QBC46DRAFT_356837 [Diplogelasinospora grovesii]|uniref:Peptidase S8/S53 domain-containing protein n=1 Tax=Diplogelasinospora grovesii TaxID=303347 RepID=A0AAN6N1S9_9PEZI|nr:hypothetical protein QBC46DRAFT_356837 [Diplogelasinospora grovesii]
MFKTAIESERSPNPDEARSSVNPPKMQQSRHHHGSQGLSTRVAVSDRRSRLYEKMVSDLLQGHDSKSLKKKYERFVKECLRDEQNTSLDYTILHWIVSRAGAAQGEHHEKRFGALQELIKIALGIDPNLLVELNYKGDTALHVALDSSASGPLVLCICDNAPDEALKAALAAKNSNGETCLHLAVTGTHDVEIGLRLVSLADPQTLLQQRLHTDRRGRVVGNTPLHDAVAYDRCVVKLPRCKEDPRGKEDEKDPKDETGEEDRECEEGPEDEKGKEGPEVEKGEEDEKDAECFYCQLDRTSARKRCGKVLDLVKALIFKNPKALALKNSVDETPYLHHLSTTEMHHLSPTEKSNLESAADDVKDYLLEYSFVLGGFRSACQCLFGAKIDSKDWKDPTFRPSGALEQDSGGFYSCYEDILDPPSVMSQVELTVPRATTPPEWERTLQIDKLQEKRNEMWQNNMGDLKDVFDLLRRKNVQRILKLTVHDNPARPCSDEVIKACLTGFDVRYLDWKKDDLSVDVVLEAAPRLAELWLYPAGDELESLLGSWAASNVHGLCGLKEMTILHLEFQARQENSESYDHHSKTVNVYCQQVLRRKVIHSRRELFLQTINKQLEQETQKWQQIKRNLERARQYLETAERDSAKHATQTDPCNAPIPSSEGEEDEVDEELENWGEDIKFWESWIETFTKEAEESEQQIQKLGEEAEQQIQKLGEEAEQQIQKLGEEAEESQQIQKLGEEAEQSEQQTQKLGGEAEQSEQQIQKLGAEAEEPEQQIPPLFNTSDGYAAWDFKVDDKLVIGEKPRKSDGEGINRTSGKEERHPWSKSVQKFLQKVERSNFRRRNPDSRVKVALIDDGIDANQEFKGVICPKGWPPTEPASEEKPFYISDTGHGTEMAHLIRSVCPYVQLYVAKMRNWTSQTGGGTREAKAETAAEAIQWAIEQDVHVISMSWSVQRKDGSDGSVSNVEAIRSLDAAIQKAAQKGIIMYCSAADGGLYGSHTEVYPKRADTVHIRAVGSATETGHPSDFVDPAQVDYLFPGEDI